MEVDVLQGHALGLLGVLEADVVEVDRAVGHREQGVLRVGDVALLDEDLAEAACALLGHGDHHEDHGQHHEAHEHAEAVGDEGGHLADAHELGLRADDGVRAEVDDEEVDEVDRERHERGHPREDALDVHEVVVELAGGGVELLLLVLLADEGLHDADARDVLLDGVVQTVVLLEDALEDGHDREGDLEHGEAEKDGDDHEHRGHGAAGDERHHDGERDHERGTHDEAEQHHVRLLDVVDVRREPGDERAGAEVVDVAEREALDLREHVVAQVAREAGGGLGAGDARHRAAEERDERHEHERHGVGGDVAEVAAERDLVDQSGRLERDEALDDDLSQDEEGGHERARLELAHAGAERLYYLAVCQALLLFRHEVSPPT